MAKTLLMLLLAGLGLGRAWAAPPLSAVPFVGCPADGMLEPSAAPAAPSILPRVQPAVAGQLAYYAADGLAVLAPRGWHCIKQSGSGGAFLLVTPRLYTTQTVPDFNSLVGPAVEPSFLNGENSGRDPVAEVFSRLFPFKRAFIREVAAIETSLMDRPRRYPSGPYPGDMTVRRSPSEVDYLTPPHRHGMGTFDSRLVPGAGPIAGAAILARSNGVDSVVLLNVRLPSRLHALTTAILGSATTN